MERATHHIAYVERIAKLSRHLFGDDVVIVDTVMPKLTREITDPPATTEEQSV